MPSLPSALAAGQHLLPGDTLESPNKRYQLRFQAHDGNVVLYRVADNAPLWHTATHVAAEDQEFVRRFAMQADGNLVAYTAQDYARWASHTNSTDYAHARLQLQNDGNLVIYTPADRSVWSSNTHSQAHWMEQIDGSRPWRQVCVPGSHDAGMYDPKMLVRDGLALTQSLSVYEQLRRGSRYFDFRPSYIEHYVGQDGFYLHHGIADGPRLEAALNDLRRFFEEGSAETVLVQFSHWKGFDAPGRDEAFVQTVLELLPAEYLLAGLPRRADGKPYASLADVPLRLLRGKIILLVDNDTMYREAVLGRGRRGIFGLGKELSTYDAYANQQQFDPMRDDQADKFRGFNAEQELFVLNWTLTPRESYLNEVLQRLEKGAGKYSPGYWLVKGVDQLAVLLSESSVQTYAHAANTQLHAEADHNRSGLFGPNAHGRIPNVINLDYLETANPVPVCLQVMSREQ